MTKYRKKPIVIEAWPVRELCRAAAHAWRDLPKPIVDAYDNGQILFADSPPRIQIETLEGWMTGNLDDMLIQGIAGEFYPCRDEIFRATYEEVGA